MNFSPCARLGAFISLFAFCFLGHLYADATSVDPATSPTTATVNPFAETSATGGVSNQSPASDPYSMGALSAATVSAPVNVTAGIPRINSSQLWNAISYSFLPSTPVITTPKEAQSIMGKFLNRPSSQEILAADAAIVSSSGITLTKNGVATKLYEISIAGMNGFKPTFRVSSTKTLTAAPITSSMPSTAATSVIVDMSNVKPSGAGGVASTSTPSPTTKAPVAATQTITPAVVTPTVKSSNISIPLKVNFTEVNASSYMSGFSAVQSLIADKAKLGMATYNKAYSFIGAQATSVVAKNLGNGVMAVYNKQTGVLMAVINNGTSDLSQRGFYSVTGGVLSKLTA